MYLKEDFYVVIVSFNNIHKVYMWQYKSIDYLLCLYR